MKLPVTLEDDTSRELPSYVDLYRPVRQAIYSVLFNLNKLKIVHENTFKEKGKFDDIEFVLQCVFVCGREGGKEI